SAGFQTSVESLPPGEGQKSLAVASGLYDRLAELRADRRTLVVAVGGGVVSDVAGFVAATYNRGLPLLMVPTTLLAMVDSSVGGKVGVNHERAKNLIGAFHQPIGVWVDTAFLDTLPEPEYRTGLAVRRGLIAADVAERQTRLLTAFGLPTAPKDWPAEALLGAMRSDKKNVGGRLRLVLPTRLGAAELVEGVPEDEVRAALTGG